MISAICPHCGYCRELRNSLLHRQVRCAKCKGVFTITEESVTAAPVEATEQQTSRQETTQAAVSAHDKSSRETKPVKVPNPLKSTENLLALCPTLQTQEEFQQYRRSILEPIQTPIPTKQLSGRYKIGLFLLGIFMVLLPLLYIAMIVGLCFAEYLYFTQTFDHFSAFVKTANVKGIILFGLLYFSFPLGLGAVILILLRPLIFGWGQQDTRMEINAAREPLLFEFVAYLCRHIGAPMPSRVFVDCQVNASAGLSDGMRGALFGGNQCDLTIGLPLVAGMTTSQFAGVLAHEFGHFTQSGARRISYIVRTVLHWFVHVYYYRDRMDQWLEIGRQSGEFYLLILAYIVSLFVWIARGLIWCMMMLGRLAAGYMSQQMEYDADAYETMLGGSESFCRSTKQLLMLTIANSQTVNDLNYMLAEERLPDDYPMLIAANMKIYQQRLEEVVSEAIQAETTSWADTHPSDRDRMEAAMKANAPGVLHVDRPASLMFRNFRALSRETTLHFYREQLQAGWEPFMLKNAGDVMDQLQREFRAAKAVEQYFQNSFLGRFLPLDQLEPSGDSVRELFLKLQQARQGQKSVEPQMGNMNQDFYDTWNGCIHILTLTELYRIGVKIKKNKKASPADPPHFSTAAEGMRMYQRYADKLNALKAQMHQRDIQAAQRFCAARELLQKEEIQNRIENGDQLHARMEALYPILKKCAINQKELDDARQKFHICATWLNMFEGLDSQQAQKLWTSFEESCDIFRRLTTRVRIETLSIPYPFEHGKKETTLADFLVPQWTAEPMEPIEAYSRFETLYTRLNITYQLMLGEVLLIALAIESLMAPTPTDPAL